MSSEQWEEVESVNRFTVEPEKEDGENLFIATAITQLNIWLSLPKD